MGHKSGHNDKLEAYLVDTDSVDLAKHASTTHTHTHVSGHVSAKAIQSFGVGVLEWANNADFQVPEFSDYHDLP